MLNDGETITVKKNIIIISLLAFAFICFLIVVFTTAKAGKVEDGKEELENLLAGACRLVATADVSDYWNRTCELNGKQDNCTLDFQVGKEINASFDTYYQDCLTAYRADEKTYNTEFLTWVINESEVSNF